VLPYKLASMKNLESGFDLQGRSQADALHIPEQDWGKAPVREFAQSCHSLQALQERLAASASNPEIKLPAMLKERCARAELVLRAALMLLHTDPHEPVEEDPAGYVREKLDGAISTFGLKVIETPRSPTVPNREFKSR
jgi:hypothetical protein